MEQGPKTESTPTLEPVQEVILEPPHSSHSAETETATAKAPDA
jgi:hypothetical protein